MTKGSASPDSIVSDGITNGMFLVDFCFRRVKEGHEENEALRTKTRLGLI